MARGDSVIANAKGVVVSFEHAQGFGRVLVEGTGEMTFDATVSLAKPHELVRGARVNVDLGPSRISGKLKVLKLWLESSSGNVVDPGDPGPDTPLHVGAYELHLPGFWRGKDVKVHEAPGVFRYNAAAADGVSFDFAVFTGAADDPDQKERLVRAYVDGHKSPRYTRPDSISVKGAPFEVHCFEGSASLGDGVAHELYVGNVYADRLMFGFVASMSDTRRDSFRRLFTTMVGTAIMRRASAVARASRQ